MNSQGHIDVEDLALFALLLLSEEEAEEVRAHVLTCAVCSAELRHVREDLTTYALSVEPAEPRGESRARFVAQLGESNGRPELASATGAGAERPLPVRPAVQSPGARRPGIAGRALPWLGWAAAAAVLVALLQVRQDRDQLHAKLLSEQGQAAASEAEARQARHVLEVLTNPSVVRVNLTVTNAPAVPAAHATYEPRSGTLLLLANNLAPLSSQKVYELWLIPANGGTPVAAGTFLPDTHGNASLVLPTLHGAIVAKAFGITVEPTGGSPTPTMPILLAGAPA